MNLFVEIMSNVLMKNQTIEWTDKFKHYYQICRKVDGANKEQNKKFCEKVQSL